MFKRDTNIESFTNFSLINNIDEKKKKNFRDRSLMSIVIIFFYLIIFALSVFADQTAANWFSWSVLSKKEIKGIFAFLFIAVLYIPLYFSIHESLNLVFSKSEKTARIILKVATSLLYLVPTVFLIISSYYAKTLDSDLPTTPLAKDEIQQEYSLINLYIIYLSIFFNSIIIILLVWGLLKKADKISFMNVFTICLLMIIVPLGFLGFALIGLLRGWVATLFVFLAVTVTDAMCYLSGMLFGKHKMAKVISPNKTWEGAIIGTILAVTILLLYAGLLTLDNEVINFTADEKIETINRSTINLWNIIQFQTISKEPLSAALWVILFFVATGLVITTILGDLMFSFIKRKYEIKDFGTALRSHGGFLDRFDSFIITSFSYIFYTFIALGILALSKNVDILFGRPYF